MSRENSRWTYTAGSRPEGVIVYDDDTKLHSHHDTDPARGQHSAFDLVRLHKFGHLDTEAEYASVTDRPSYSAMVEFAHQLGEIRAGRAEDELTDLGPPTEGELIDGTNSRAPVVSQAGTGGASGQPDTSSRFRVYSASEFGSGPPMDWIVRGLLPRAELAVVYGESGSGKTFFVVDLCAAVQRGFQWRGRRTIKGRVAYICAEGASGFKTRLRAYSRGHSVDLVELPSVIPDAPNLLDPKDVAAIVKSIKDYFGKQS